MQFSSCNIQRTSNKPYYLYRLHMVRQHLCEPLQAGRYVMDWKVVAKTLVFIRCDGMNTCWAEHPKKLTSIWNKCSFLLSLITHLAQFVFPSWMQTLSKDPIHSIIVIVHGSKLLQVFKDLLYHQVCHVSLRKPPWKKPPSLLDFTLLTLALEYNRGLANRGLVDFMCLPSVTALCNFCAH